MGTFLDLRSSMNANATGSIGVSLTTTPALFGIIGLQTQNVANPIVTLTGTIGISGFAGLIGSTFTISVVRGTTGGTTIYTATVPFSLSIAEAELVSFTAQDLLAPAAAETVYTAFISGSAALVASGARVGPEVFWGVASSSV
ncbi:hypothetical protein ACFQWB_14270 [Paenibacillus thermoaerophilus]|uniref:BclA C-terminal domain-containing protein n=1 Tax=Paenibacillus thermoaerophilus TaxID=1215385 RepID=A0ABW2V8I5_9BACL|nr:hypothetical protein [Paenibacillus thermoaerophilus]TMV07347.1 hypothetical protein FE781_15865 [Paenibacillus thermoaerophilus]